MARIASRPNRSASGHQRHGRAGKTVLAIQWAHRVASRFPDGQLCLNLRGFGPDAAPVSPGEGLGLFLEARHLRRTADAIACFQQSLSAFRELGDQANQAEILTHLAAARQADGNIGAARSCLRRALAILTELKQPDAAQVPAKLTELDPAPPARQHGQRAGDRAIVVPQSPANGHRSRHTGT